MSVTGKAHRPDLRARLSFSEPARALLIKAGIIACVVMLSAAIGLLTGSRSHWLAAALIAGGVVGLAALLYLAEHLEWSVILLMVTALFSNLSLPTGTSSRIVDTMVITLLFGGLWFLRMLVVERRFHLAKSPANLPLLGWMAVALISLAWSNVFRDPQVVVWDTFPFVQFASTVLMVALPVAFLLVGNFASSKKLLAAATWLMIIGGAVGIAGNFLGRALANTGGLVAMWTMALCVGLALYQKSLPKIAALALLAVAGAWFWWSFVLSITWVSGWLPGLVAVGVLIFFRSKKLFAALAIAAVLLAAVNLNYYLGRVQAERVESGSTRVAAWQMNWKVTGQHLLLGTGPGGYAAYYMSYFPNNAMATHNNYIDVISQTGILGTVCWLWFFGAVLWQGFRLRNKLKGRGDFYEALTNAIFAGTVGCVVIMMFGDWVLPFAYTQTIAGFRYAVFSWIFMGSLVAVEAQVSKEEPVETHA